MRSLACDDCGCKVGAFEIEGDELVLHFECGHEDAGLVMNLDYIGYEETNRGKPN